MTSIFRHKEASFKDTDDNLYCVDVTYELKLVHKPTTPTLIESTFYFSHSNIVNVRGGDWVADAGFHQLFYYPVSQTDDIQPTDSCGGKHLCLPW